MIDYGHGETFTITLSKLDILTLLPFLYFIPLYVSLIYGVFLFQGIILYKPNNFIQNYSLKFLKQNFKKNFG
jgi:hypothetical protein